MDMSLRGRSGSERLPTIEAKVVILGTQGKPVKRSGGKERREGREERGREKASSERWGRGSGS